MAAQRSTDHVQRGLAKLTEQFRELPHLEAILTIGLRAMQEGEDALWEVITERYHPKGVGVDNLGAIVGRLRAGMPDDIFLRFINAQILANRASGRIDELLEIYAIVTDGAPVVALEAYPAAILWEHQSTVDPLPVFLLLYSAKGGGVRFLLTYSDVPAEDGDFAFSEAWDASSTDEVKGFGAVEDPSIGGRLRGVFV